MKHLNLTFINRYKNEIDYSVNFWLLSTGRFISHLGTAMFSFAISLYVLDLTGSAAAFSMIISASILPGVFINIFAGVYVDKHDKKSIIVIADILSGLMVLLFMIFFIFFPKNLPLFLCYAIVLSIIQAFYTLAVNAAIPNVVGRESVTKTNSIFQTIRAVINISGPLIGALAYKSMGMTMIFWVNGISFIISGIAEIFIKFSDDQPIKNTNKGVYFEEIKNVFRYLKTETMLTFLLIFSVIINFFYNPLILVAIPYINYHVIKVSGTQLSYIQSASAIGLILGSLLVTKLRSDEVFLKNFFVFLIIQAFLIYFWILPETSLLGNSSKLGVTVLFCILLTIYGIMQSAQNIPMISHFQLKVPPELRGRIFGIFYTALQLTTPIGICLYGLCLEKIKWVYIILFSACIMMLLSFIGSKSKYFREFKSSLRNSPVKGE